MPSVSTTTTAEGVAQKCYNVEQFKTLLLIVSDYHGLYDWRLTTLGILSANKSIINSYELALSNKDNQIKVLTQDREFLNLRLKQSYKVAESQSKSLQIERILMWGVIVVQSGVILVAGIKGVAQ